MATKYAVMGDIHGNLEALEAVLKDMAAEKIDKIAILGDTVGYGPNPRECIEKAAEIADIFLIGNHEKELISGDPGMTEETKEVLKWTKGQLKGCAAWEKIINCAKQSNPALASKDIDDKIFVHGSPLKPTDQYIWPAHECQYLIYNDQIDERLQEFMNEFIREHGFCAHTHQPAVLTEYKNRKIFDPYKHELKWNKRDTFIGPNTIFFVPEGNITLEGLAGKKMVINPGSVGQPRDGNPAASYAIYDGNTVQFRRVPYDFKKTQEKIMALPISERTKIYNAKRLEKGE